MSATRGTTTRLRIAALVVAPALALTGCGLDDQGQEVADGIRTALSGGDDGEAARDLAACTAERWVGETGVGRLRDDGLIRGEEEVLGDNVRATVGGDRPVSRETARDYARARVSCLDYDQESLAAADSYPGASEEELDDYADCLKDIGSDLREDALTEQTLGNGGSQAQSRLQRQVGDCRQDTLGPVGG